MLLLHPCADNCHFSAKFEGQIEKISLMFVIFCLFLVDKILPAFWNFVVLRDVDPPLFESCDIRGVIFVIKVASEGEVAISVNAKVKRGEMTSKLQESGPVLYSLTMFTGHVLLCCLSLCHLSLRINCNKKKKLNCQMEKLSIFAKGNTVFFNCHLKKRC